MRIVPYLATGVALLATSAAFAQSTATLAAVPATAKIFVAITQTLTNSGLAFGDIFQSPTGGNVVLDPTNDNRTVTGGLTLGVIDPFNSATILVGGRRNATFAITLPANGTVSLIGPGAAMPVNAFTAAVGAVALVSPFTSQLPNTAGASLTFKVGGTLVVGPLQTDGDYAGTFPVTVAYN
ncbi:MAG TPA: hypothetical protein DHV93_09830 [Holophagaceae bacterium]|nr:hypothetical protein [Holophagaceae bacterium]